MTTLAAVFLFVPVVLAQPALTPDGRDAVLSRARAAKREKIRLEELAKQQQSLERDKAIAESQKAYRGHTDEMTRLGQSAPNDFDTQLAAGGSFLELGESGRGKPFLQRSVELGQDSGDPRKEAKARGLLAQLHLQDHDFVRAREEAKKALALDPNEKAALLALRMSEGRVSGAGRSAGAGATTAATSGGAAPAPTGSATAAPAKAAAPQLEAAFAASRNEAALAAVRRALSLGDLEAARRELARAKAAMAGADDARLRLAAALIARAAGELAAALAELDEALRLDPTRRDAHAERAVVLAKLGRKAEEVREAFLRSGGLERDFSAFYAAQADAAAGAASDAGSGGGKSGWEYGQSQAEKRRLWATRGLLGLGLIVLAGALLRLLRRRDEDAAA